MDHTFSVVGKAGALKMSVTTNLTVDVNVIKVPVPVITVAPMPVPNLPDNTPAGTVFAKATVTNTDGSAYTGTLAISAQTVTGMFALVREGTTNVWDIATTAVTLVDGVAHVTLSATE